MSLLSAFLPGITGKVQQWIAQQREQHIGGARPLTQSERAFCAAYFPDATLSAARVRLVEGIENPPFLEGLLKQAAFFGIRVQFDFRTVSGITFVDCILIRQKEMSTSLLFHELVHAEQYRQLGLEAFARAYVKGMADGGFIYERIPLETVAAEMTARFASGQKFSVERELSSWLREQGYL